MDIIFWELLFWLVIGHAFCDYTFQTDAMAKGKNRHNKMKAPTGQKYIPCWPYWLSAHALIHAGAVAFITGSVIIGMIEFVVHWVTDFLKCDKHFNVHTDQFIHIACKVGYVIYLTN